jgi:uncharacterized protein (PEP-CTERM system associated)
MKYAARTCLATMLLSAASVGAQTGDAGAVKRVVSIVPRLTITETLTDNAALSSQAMQSEQTTEVTPGVRISVEGARLKTFFDYSLSYINYAQGTAPSRNQNALNTFGSFEAVENWAFIDFNGTISQQTVSAFGTQSTSATAVNANRTEVANYSLSPYVRGRFGSAANYEARLTRTTSSSDGNAVSNNASTSGAVKLSNASAFRSLGWSLDLSRQTQDYSAGRSTESDQVSAGLIYTVNPQLNLTANAGRESSNFTSADKTSYDTSSLGLNWIPSERTKVSALRGQRSFGDSHTVNLEHRSARTSWRYSDSRDITTTPGQSGVGNNYDQNLAQQNSVLGTAGNAVGNFLTSAVSVQRRQDLSFALLGIRDTATFSLTRTQTNRLDILANTADSLTNANEVVQQGFSVNLSHRLTPDYSLGLLLSQQDTSGSVGAQDNTLRTMNLNLSGKVGKRTSATLGAHRTVSDGAAKPYSESAVTGNLNVQF